MDQQSADVTVRLGLRIVYGNRCVGKLGSRVRQNFSLIIYRWTLALPIFRGRGRIQEVLRRFFFPFLVADVNYGLRMEIDPWEWGQIAILKDGCTEPETLCVFEKILRPGDTYYDVGAHVGFHVLVARHFVGPTGRLVAIEPQPYNCDRILRNSALNEFRNITVIVGAAGDTCGEIVLHEQGIRDKSRLSIALESVNDLPQKFLVPMIQVAQLMENCGDRLVRLIKIDVEGYEPNVVKGVGVHLPNVENIILEILPDSMDRAETSSMIISLREHGYELLTVRGETWKHGTQLPENNLWATRLARIE
jgi:FkbM family methyltransferase